MTEFLTIAEASTLIGAKKLSPVELTQACLDRVRKLDNTLSGIVNLIGDGRDNARDRPSRLMAMPERQPR